MRRSVKSVLALSCMALALGSCGGGGGGGGGGAPAPPAPPPPPPPPPPPSATIRAFSAVPAASFFYIFSHRDRVPNDPSFSGGYGNRQGQYGNGTGPALQSGAFGPLAGRDPATLDTYSLTATGIEQAGSTYVVFLAPSGSRAFSPTTTLIEWAQSQDAVKRALGLDSGVFALQTQPDLLRYDAVAALASADEEIRREGARVAAANLRAMAAAAVAERFGQAGLSQTWTMYQYQLLGQYIAGRPGSFLFSNAEMARFLRTLVPAGTYRDDVIEAAAHLVDAYAAAIGVQVADTEQAARFTLGIRGYLLEEVDLLLRANSAAAAAAALAVDTTQILARTARYRETLPFPAAGFFFPGPDFYALAAGGQIVVPGSGFGNGSLTTNDFYANGPNASIGFFPGTTQTISVSVPAANAGQVGADLRPDGTVLITALGGFTGVTYFDYAVRHQTGDQAAGRVYVMIR